MILIGTVQGDVIESGGVKNVTKHYHYYERKKTFVDDCGADTDGEVHDLCLPSEEPVAALPEQLCICRSSSPYHDAEICNVFSTVPFGAGV